ncbi:hypothetical protein ZWY2020_006174 [Hordeum vulgare]|nr:hypothetical protein ZWY2020_006174 [Hordeum vulgare]
MEAAEMAGRRVRGGMNILMKTLGEASLRRTTGVTSLGTTVRATSFWRGNDAVSLVRLALVRLGCPHCLCHPKGWTKTGRMMGLGASRRSGRWPPSWAASSPQPRTAPSSSSFGRCPFMAGKLPMMCTPTISNALITKTLIDSRAGLNVLSVETFETLQLSYKQLMPTKPFSGVTEGSTEPTGQVRLPVTFGERKNYHTEIIVFDVAHIHLPYNKILGYPTHTKFMRVAHDGYNVLKMPGSSGIITIACDEKDVICTLERAYCATAVECSDDEEGEPPREDQCKKKKQLLPAERTRTSGSMPRHGVLPPIA